LRSRPAISSRVSSGYYGVEYLNLNPNGIFHAAVFVHFCEAFLGIKSHWILFRKFFRVKPQPSATNPRVVGGAGIQLRENAAEQYLAYKLVDSNTDWKTRWFYITNHHPGLPKPSGRQPRHREWWNTEPTMQEGIQLPELLARIKVLREAVPEGRARGLQFHEAEGAAIDGSRHLGLRVHQRRRHVADAQRRAGRQRHH
jgi:ribosomal protein L13E